MTLQRTGSWLVLWAAGTAAAAAMGCGGTDQVNLGDSGSGADVTAPPPDAGPFDDATSNDGTVPPSDGATTDGTATDAAAFTPLDLPGLALWLDAEHKTTLDSSNRLQTWGDLSGNANDAAQAGVNSRPTVTAKAINNLPGVHFEAPANTNTGGPFLSIADSATLQWGTGDYTLAIVARFSNTTANAQTNAYTGVADFYWKSTFNGTTGAGIGLLGNIPTAQYPYATVGLAASLDAADYVFTPTAYNDNAGRLYLTRRAGSTLELRVNAASTATQTAPNSVNVSAAGTPVLIGAIANGFYYRLAGDICEMIAVKGAISDPDLAQLEGYLKAKYGL